MILHSAYSLTSHSDLDITKVRTPSSKSGLEINTVSDLLKHLSGALFVEEFVHLGVHYRDLKHDLVKEHGCLSVIRHLLDVKFLGIIMPWVRDV